MTIIIISIPNDIDLQTDLQTEFQPDGQWAAIDRNTYEAESDSEGWWSKSPVGHGKTEQEAIADLIEQIEELAAIQHDRRRAIEMAS